MRNESIETNGAIVFWKIAQRSDRPKIAEGLRRLGMDSYIPNPRTSYAVLTDAARECVGKGYLIRPLEKNRGVAIVRERRGEVSSGNDYHNKAQVLCPSNGHIDVQYGLDYDQEARLNVAYNAMKDALPPSAVGTALSKIAVHAMGGTKSLRDSGGIYWMRQAAVPYWKEVVDIFEGAACEGSSDIYTVTTSNTPETIRAIRDSIIEEVRNVTLQIRSAIRDDELGAQALATRSKTLAAYNSKLTLYESVIGEALEDVRRELVQTQHVAAEAELVALAGE